MARKPNYRFERMERQRMKTAKKAEKAKARAEKSEKDRPDVGESPDTDIEHGDATEGENDGS